MEFKIPMVIHDKHGGFSLTNRIHGELEKRKVPWLSRLGKSGSCWYLPYEDGEDLRRDETFVDIVRHLFRELEAKENELDWREWKALEQETLDGLRVVDVRVVIEVHDHDGKETVRVTGGTW